MSKKIYELIMMLEDEIDNSPKPRMSAGNKRIVDCDRMLDLLGDIKVMIPEEVRQAQVVLSERTTLMEEAKTKSASLLADARLKSEKLVSREGVIAEAKSRAEAIIKRAEENAELIAQGARGYTDDILSDVQRYLSEYVEIIERNRKELHQAYDPVSDDFRESEEVETEEQLVKIDEALQAAVTRALAGNQVPDQEESIFMDAFEEPDVAAYEEEAVDEYIAAQEEE